MLLLFYSKIRSSLEAEIFNDGTEVGDVLNLGCGADFVKVIVMMVIYVSNVTATFLEMF